jgi:hypothetical protein
MNITSTASQHIPSAKNPSTGLKQRSGAEIQHTFLLPKGVKFPDTIIEYAEGTPVPPQLPEDLKNPNRLSENLQHLAEVSLKLLEVFPEFFVGSKIPRHLPAKQSQDLYQQLITKYQKELYPSYSVLLGNAPILNPGKRGNIDGLYRDKMNVPKSLLSPDESFSCMLIQTRAEAPVSKKSERMKHRIDMNLEFSEHRTHPELDTYNLLVQARDTEASQGALSMIDQTLSEIKKSYLA